MIKSEKEIPFLSIFVYVDHVQCGEKKELELSAIDEISLFTAKGGRGGYFLILPLKNVDLWITSNKTKLE